MNFTINKASVDFINKKSVVVFHTRVIKVMFFPFFYFNFSNLKSKKQQNDQFKRLQTRYSGYVLPSI